MERVVLVGGFVLLAGLGLVLGQALWLPLAAERPRPVTATTGTTTRGTIDRSDAEHPPIEPPSAARSDPSTADRVGAEPRVGSAPHRQTPDDPALVPASTASGRNAAHGDDRRPDETAAADGDEPRPDDPASMPEPDEVADPDDGAGVEAESGVSDATAGSEDGASAPTEPPLPSVTLKGAVTNGSQQPMTEGVAYLVAETDWPFTDDPVRPASAGAEGPDSDGNGDADDDPGALDDDDDDPSEPATDPGYDGLRQLVGRSHHSIAAIGTDGRFRFDGLPLATAFRLIVFSPQLPDRVTTRRWESPGWEDEVWLPVDVPAFNGTVTFRFLHDGSGQRLRARAIALRPSADATDLPEPFQKVNDDFRFEFAIRRSGTYRVDVLLEAPAAVAPEEESRPLWHIRRGELELATDVEREVVVRVIGPGTPITGRLVDRTTGKPLAGRELTLVHGWEFPGPFTKRPRDHDSATVVSGPDGRFRIPAVATVGTLTLRIILDPDRMRHTVRRVSVAQLTEHAGSELHLGDVPIEDLFPEQDEGKATPDVSRPRRESSEQRRPDMVVARR